MQYPFGERASIKRANFFQRLGRVIVFTGIAAALLTIFVLLNLYRSLFWTPLEQFYWKQYTRAAHPSFYNSSLDYKGESNYQIFALKRAVPGSSKPQTRLPQITDVEWRNGTCVLTQQTIQSGWQVHSYSAAMKDDYAYQWFRQNFYGGRDWSAMFYPPIYAGAFVWFLMVGAFVYWDLSDRKDSTERKVTSDSETQLVEPAQLAEIIKGDGIGIPYLTTPTFIGRLQGYKSESKLLRIRRKDEAQHFMIVADIGQGKSSFIHWMLHQIKASNLKSQRVIIYDPSLEFWERHYDPKRGDILLHPLYEDMPFWDMAAEIETSIDAGQLANSFLPPKDENTADFFEKAGLRLLTFLFIQMKLQKVGSPELLYWLEHSDLIDEMIKQHDPTLMPLIAENAAPQRAGVFSSLNMISEAIKMLPGRKKELEYIEQGVKKIKQVDRPTFSFRDWADNNQQGWIFIASRFNERSVLKPLISAWLDTLFGILMRHPGGPETFFFLDELPTLQRLPKLKGAVQEGRKYNLKMVLSFQGRAQTEALYRKEAETLMSAPATRLFMRTQEYAAAEWCAKNIGMPEQERENQSVSASTQGRDSENSSIERKMDYLVRPNQIQNLEKFTGYVRYDRYATKIQFDRLDLPVIHTFKTREQALLKSTNREATKPQDSTSQGNNKTGPAKPNTASKTTATKSGAKFTDKPKKSAPPTTKKQGIKKNGNGRSMSAEKHKEANDNQQGVTW